jgi:DNA-directed RNA polymerase subunit RPC12/RpoP
MDIDFKCPHCQQDLSVDSTASGTEIECPACGEPIIIPVSDQTPANKGNPNPMAASAGAKEEKHFTVPVRKVPAESLINKPLPPLEVAAKEGIKLRVKTIRHSDCVEVGKDHFDEVVTNFLHKIGDANVVTVSTFNYTHMDLGTRAWVTDYGILVLYRG